MANNALPLWAHTSSTVQLLTATWIGEAEDQPEIGRAGVLHVIANRVHYRRQTWRQAILAPAQFSCWWNNTAERYQHMRVGRVNEDNNDLTLSYLAMPDPTGGADHYLNVELVLKTVGHLPSWVAAMTETAKIEDHTFYRSKEAK